MIPLFLLSFTLGDNLCGYEGVDLLTVEEKPCTTMRTGMVRFSQDNHIEICAEKQWKPYQDCCMHHVDYLIGHWLMDEQTGNEVADDSGFENHGMASGAIPKLSKFSRGRYFNSDGIIRIPSSPSLNFGVSSFSVSGWQKTLSVTYPLTTFAVKKGYKCHEVNGTPGWDTGHSYKSDGLNVCILDNKNKRVDDAIVFDDGYRPAQLIGQWVHYVVVFDRNQNKVFVYVNGKKQSNWVDISLVKGSVDNVNSLEFGRLHGWKTKGTLDDYRVFSKALDANDVNAIYNRIV